MIVLNTLSSVGSVDVDTALKRQYPDQSRWDFVIGLQGAGAGQKRLIWIEVHPAGSTSISAVLAKLEWLKGWLQSHGGNLGSMTSAGDYYWLSNSGIKIKPASQAARRLAQAGLKGPARRLVL